MEAASTPPWSELPLDLIGSVVTRLPSAADCARVRAVCRSWHSAMRHHGYPTRQQPPWAVFPDGYFFTSSEGMSERWLTSFPENASCIGSTDGWLALDCIDDVDEKRHSYLLHHHFSNTTVLLPELDTVIGNVPKYFEIRKVLMRSTPDDVVVLMPNNRNYPIILIRPGKGVWLPKPQTTPFTRIIDVAFLGDKLYGITQAEDLVCLDIAFDGDGIPMVTEIHHVIKHSTDNDDSDLWSDVDEDEDQNEDENEAENNDDEDDAENIDDEATIENDDGMLSEEDRRDVIFEGIVYTRDDDVPHEPKDIITTNWYFLESRGKLFMVRRQTQCPRHNDEYTRKVEVFEADISVGVWVPVVGGLSGQAFFISDPFCKSIHACGEIEEDTIHFIDTRDTFNMRSQTISAPQWDSDYHHLVLCNYSGSDRPTWIFPPELVI